MFSDITDVQRRLLDGWLGTWQTVDDYSWPLQDTAVLHVRTADQDCIVKAATSSHHIPREIAAHRQVLHTVHGVAPALLYESAADFLLVTRYQPGEIVESSVESRIPPRTTGSGVVHTRRLPTTQLADPRRKRVRHRLRSRRTAALDHDLYRLRNRQFVGRPDLEEAFFDGLGITIDADDARGMGARRDPSIGVHRRARTPARRFPIRTRRLRDGAQDRSTSHS